MKTKNRLILAGGGGFGRELASWADHATAAGSIPPLAGFIDDRPEAMANHNMLWLGSFNDYQVRPGDLFLLGVGNPRTKVHMVASLRARGAQFANLIHPSAVLGRNNILGEGVIMAPMSMNTSDTRMGDFVTLLSFSGLGHDASAGAFTTISSHVDVMGGASLGERVLIGSGARIMPNIKVGDDVKIGPSSLVMRHVKAGTTIYTPPGKRLTTGLKQHSQI